ncbi:MAG: hypothetical protein AAFX55_16530 [Bacteroidota bacterium]
MKINKLFILLIPFFFQGTLQEIGLPPVIFKIFSEGVLVIGILPFLLKIKLKKDEVKILFAVGLYIMWAILSAVYNDQNFYYALAYTRYTILGIMLFFVASRLKFNKDNCKLIFYALAGIAVLQIVASLINSGFLSQSVERKVGTLGNTGGVLATIFTIFIMPFFLFYYLKVKNMYYLLLSLSTLVIGIASGKRAVIFYFLILSIITIFKSQKNKLNPFKVVLPVVLILISVNIAILNVSSGVINGVFEDFTGNYGEATTYAIEYSTGLDTRANATGRIGASQNIITNITDPENIDRLFFGYGPSTLMGEMIFRPFNIVYGIVGWGMDVISVGLPSLIIYCIIIYMLWRRIRKIKTTNDVYFNTLVIGTRMAFITWFIAHFTYSGIFVKGPIPALLLMFLCGFLIGHSRNISNNSFLLKNNER